MISGALLLSKDEPIKTFFKKRASKILIPFVVWVTFYVIWSQRRNISDLTIETFFRKMISDEAYYHLWFLYALVGLYLITPVLRKITNKNDLSIPIYFAICWFLAEAVGNLFSMIMGYSHGFRLGSFEGYTGYFLLGFILFTVKLSPVKERIIYVLGLIGLFFTFYGTYVHKVETGELSNFWYSNLSFNTIFVSSAVFVLFKQRFQNYKPGKFMKLMANYSFGIYLVHPFILDIFNSETLRKIIGFKINYNSFGHPTIGVIITLICLYVVSLITVYIIKKVPIVRKTV